MFPDRYSLLASGRRPITAVIARLVLSELSDVPRAWSRAARGLIRHANDMGQI